MEMKAISYICAIFTSVFIMLQQTDSKQVEQVEMAVNVNDSISVKISDYEVEKKMREVELLKSEVKIGIKELEIKNNKQ